MPADVQIEEATGAGPSYTVKNTEKFSRYFTEDTPASTQTSNPIPIPQVDGKIHPSYWKTHLINVTAAPSTYIENLRWYINWSSDPDTEWSLSQAGDGDVVVGVSSATNADQTTLSQGMHSGSYDQAVGAVGTSGNLISGTHSYYSTYEGTTSTWDFSSQAGALMVQSGQVVGNTTGRSLGVVTQVLVGSGATQGEKTDKTVTMVYDEV